MTPLTLVQRELQVLVQALVPEREQGQERAAQLAQELEQRAQQEPPELQVQEPEPVLKLEPQEQLWQEPKPAPELHVFLERLPLRQGSTQHI